jgi:uncharacterized protein (TIGR03000 family)
MRRTLAVIGCWLVLVSCSRGEPWDSIDVPGRFPIPRPSHNVKDWGPLDYDDTPGAVPGGLVFIKQGNQRIWRFGGALLPMRVRVTEPGPDGPVTTQLVLPSSGQSPAVPLVLQHQTLPFAPRDQAVSLPPAPDRACVQVHIPDPIGLLYIDGRLTDTAGASRQVQSPALGHDQLHVFRLRAAFKSGENLLIEEREVAVRVGQVADVTFDGSRATAVPLPRAAP